MARVWTLRSIWMPGAALALACGGGDAPPRGDSAADTAGVFPASADRPDWARELGELLLVPSDSDNAAVVLFPDTPSARAIASGTVTLLNAAGEAVVARAELDETQQCGDAPVVRLEASIPSGWSVGLLRRVATPLRMDSIESLPSADSTRLAADLARLGSTLTKDTESRFEGLPFTTLGAHRIVTDSQQILVAHLVRRLPQEAAPLEEHLLIVAERAARESSSWTLKYNQRSEGSEDTAEHFEALAAVRGRDRILLLLARDQLARTRYEILERSADGVWRSRWSRILAC